jgi:DNA (cytosine-5)-methyltransferase 1
VKPKLLDLCGCEGGASVGYDRARFDVYAVDMDKNRLRRNPFHTRLDDALEVLRRLLAGERLAFSAPDGSTVLLGLCDFAAIHVSPPCQGYTRGNAGKVTDWPMLIPDFRALLVQTGLPYVIENVTDAAWDMVDPVALCGCMFSLSTIDTDGIRIHLKRERMFETNWGLTAPRACQHDGIEWWAGAYGGARRDKYEAKYVRKGGYVPPEKAVVMALLGIEHDMTWQGLFECLPPAYTEHIGRQLLSHIESERAA